MAILSIKVKPNAKENRIIKVNPLEIRIAAQPKDGEANRAIVAFIASELGIAKSCVAIIAGHTIKNKKLEITGLSSEEILEKLSRGLQKKLL